MSKEATLDATNETNDDDDGTLSSTNELHGVLVSYKDDQLNSCVNLALKHKSRVRYKCMDTFSNFLAFGTSSGAIYLFKLKSMTHSSCSLVSKIPCDQGSIEVIKFLPNPQADDLLVAIGTTHGSVVAFRLTQLPGEQNPVCNEIYKAECFTPGCSIKFIEYDQDLFDPVYPFTKLYICDTANRLYVLESSTICATKQSLRLFYSSQLPSLILSIKDSKINQLSAHRSQLLISTDETTRLFSEQSTQQFVIGKKKRKEGFYGACFFNPNYKPTRILQVDQQQAGQRRTTTASTSSLNEIDDLLVFVARPLFRLWQVNNQLSVMFTHQFEPLIRSLRFNRVVELHNEPIDDEDKPDDPTSVLDNFTQPDDKGDRFRGIKSDHFQKLVPIYSSTLGNLLLSYTSHEIFVADPIGAKLIVWHSQEASIKQVCASEHELFIWSSFKVRTADGNEELQFRVERLVLLAPTQFVLELHRLHRYTTLIKFVELFAELFRRRMALPLYGSSVITTEGGLLRNVLLNAWDMYETRCADGEPNKDNADKIRSNGKIGPNQFKKIVDEIIEESEQMRRSFENLTDSRFFLTMTNENIDRLCSEPYASLVSLQVSIAELHTNHVIHFNKDALNRHKSVANLSQGLKNLSSNTNQAKSSLDLASNRRPPYSSSLAMTKEGAANGSLQQLGESKVIVERQKPKARSRAHQVHQVEQGEGDSINQVSGQATAAIGRASARNDPVSRPFFSVKEVAENISSESDSEELGDEEKSTSCSDDRNSGELASSEQDIEKQQQEEREQESRWRCPNCQWPRRGSHLNNVNSKKKKVELKLIEDSLMSNFEENIDQIEERAFRHGIWCTYLKCLAFKNRLDEYITCCMMLDDVRLLNIEQFVITRGGEDEVIDCLLAKMSQRLYLATKNNSAADDDGETMVCLKCEHQLESLKVEGDDYQTKALSFNVVNLAEQLISRRNADIKRVINSLLKFPGLLNRSKIPSTFYLKAIATASSPS